MNDNPIAQDAQRQVAEVQTAILDALPAHIALLDAMGVIVSVNEAWRRFASANVLQSDSFLIGQDYLGVCESAHGDCAEEAQAAADGIRRVLAGEQKEFSLEYPCHSTTEKRWFRLMVAPLSEDRLAGAVVMHVNVTERRLAEEILRENQHRLEIEARRLRESQLVANVGSWETDLSSFEITWTEQSHRIFETSPDHYKPSYRSFLERVHPDDRAALDATLNQSMVGSGRAAFEHRVPMPDGRIKYVEERWHIYRNAAGEPIRALGTCQDITERKLAADSLAQSQVLLRIAGQAARLGGWSIELPDYQLTWSDQTFLIHDLPVGDIPTFEEAIHFYPPEYRDEVARLVKLCAEEGEPFDFEVEIITAKQRRIWVRAVGEAVRDAKGQIRRIQGAFQDISQQKAGEEAARSAAARLLDTVESITDGFFTLDHEGRFTYVNAESERLLNCHRSTLLGRPVWEVYPPVVGTVFDSEYRRAAAGNTTVTFEDYYPPLDMWIEVKAYPSAEGMAVYFRDVSERHRTLRALRASEASLIRAQQIARIGNWDWNIVTDEVYWSAQVFELFGLVPSELDCNYETFRHSVHPEDRERTHQALQDAIAGNAPYNIEHRVLWPDGTVRVMHEMGEVIRDANGQALKMTGTVQDITERKLAEKARQRMQTALINVSAAVSATTGKQFFEQLADHMAQALGAQASFVAQFLPGEPLTARTIAATVDGQRADNFDYVVEGTPCEGLSTSDTCIISAHASQQFPGAPNLAALGAQSYVGRRLDSSTGKFLGLLYVLFREPLQEPDFVAAMLQIFAARAASELERQETDERVREQATLLDKAPDGVFVRDLDHKILYWNHGAERLFGWSAAEALGRNVRELIPRDAPSLDAAFEKLMASGESVREIEHHTVEGNAVVIERHCSLIHDDQGKPRSVLSINTDITERKRIEAQYLRAQRMESIGTLAGGIAHDLNNVLAPIMMSIELLKMEEQNPLRLELISMIALSAQRGADMVQQVLSFARGVEGQKLEVQVGHLIQETKKIIRDTFHKNIEVCSKIPSDLLLVRGDPTQLHQVLLNLCVNSRDAMPDGGTLTLSASNFMLDEQQAEADTKAAPGPYVCIEVEDSGSGMTPGVIERIFEPFFTTKELGKGTGLGLSTSIAIIKSHGGFAQVSSEVGKGTRFQVYLPAHAAPGTAEKDAAPIELPRGKGELVLVVDDEAAVRQITQQTLEVFGYQVVVASDGTEACSIYAARKDEIAVVLTDMMMPTMDGPAMIQVLLKLDPKVRIIAASGLNANAMVANVPSAGVKHFLAKPFTAETLLNTLREVLED